MRTRKPRGGATVLMMTVVISGALTSILAARQVQRITTEPQWVASSNLDAGQVISYEALTEIRAEKNPSAIKSQAQLVGKILTADKKAGTPFFGADISAPARSWLAEKVPEGRVLYTLVPRNNTIPHTLLRNGDRLDVLVTSRRGVRTLAQDVRLIGVIKEGPQNPSSSDTGRSLITRLASKNASKNEDAESENTPLIIAVKPEEVYPLASIGPYDSVSLVLHGEADIKQGRKLNINPMQSARHQIEVFSGLERKQVFTTY